MEGWIGFNESLFLPRAVTLTSKSGLSEKMSAHTINQKIVETRADGDVCKCVWFALRYCYCSYPIWSSWRHSSQGARLSIPKKNCKSPKFICITSTSNILNIEVVIKTPMHEQWLHVHQLCSKLESWQLNSNAAPSFIHPAAPHPSAAGKNHLLLLCLAW